MEIAETMRRVGRCGGAAAAKKAYYEPVRLGSADVRCPRGFLRTLPLGCPPTTRKEQTCRSPPFFKGTPYKKKIGLCIRTAMKLKGHMRNWSIQV